MQFGVFLVDNGVITCDEFFEAVKLQLRTRPQLGGLAIERRKLNARQVFSVLREQCDSPVDLFGELAVQLGYLTNDELSELVHEQLLRVRPLSEILVEMDLLTPEARDVHYREFRRTMEQCDESALAIAGA
jgi:hypothetical protein